MVGGKRERERKEGKKEGVRSEDWPVDVEVCFEEEFPSWKLETAKGIIYQIYK